MLNRVTDSHSVLSVNSVLSVKWGAARPDSGRLTVGIVAGFDSHRYLTPLGCVLRGATTYAPPLRNSPSASVAVFGSSATLAYTCDPLGVLTVGGTGLRCRTSPPSRRKTWIDFLASWESARSVDRSDSVVLGPHVPEMVPGGAGSSVAFVPETRPTLRSTLR